jgi:hypothetical protein
MVARGRGLYDSAMTTPRLLAAALALAPAVAVAQPAARAASDTTPIPRELVLGLLGPQYDLGPGAAAIVVGRVPKGFPMDVIPPDVERILGGLEARGPGRGEAQGGTVVLVVPRSAPDAMAWLTAHAERAGFKAPRWPGMGRLERGGFVDERRDVPAFLCRGDSLLYSQVTDAATGRYLAIRARDTRGGHSPCRMDDDAAIGPIGSITVRGSGGLVPAGFKLPAMPTLRLPAGVESHGVDMSMEQAALQSSVRVDASGPPGELLAHFAKQLKEAGWTLGAPVLGTTMAMQTAQKREEDGRELFATLFATIVPGTTERDVLFRMVWPSSQQR